MAGAAKLRWALAIAGIVVLALASFVVLTGRTHGLLSSDAEYWCKRQYPEHDAYETRFEPLPFRAGGLRVGALSCQSSSSVASYTYVGLPSSRGGVLVAGPALWSRIEGPILEKARAATRILIGEAIRIHGLDVDATCPIEPNPDGSLRFCVSAPEFAHKWHCTIEPGGSFGCNLRSPVDVIAMCRKHGAKAPIQGRESELGEVIAGYPVVPLKGGPSRIVGWTPGEITTATLQCGGQWGEKEVHFGWDAAGRIYEGAELARQARGDVAKRAALAALLLLPPWKASDGWILASEKAEVCGDLYSPNDDDGILEFNTVSTFGADSSERPPTFAKCRIDLTKGKGQCAPKAAHPCPEAKF